jgi:GTP-binding protein
VHHLLPLIDRVAQAHARQLPTVQLNRGFQDWSKRLPPPSYKGKQARIFYATQVATKPPHLAIFTSAPEGIPRAYERYLEKQLRDTFDLIGTPVKLSFRARRQERRRREAS